MSRKNQYTNGFIEMSGREYDGWTKAFVQVAIKSDLTMSERRTLCVFEQVWESGSDFTEDRTYDLFLAMLRRQNVPIKFKRKPSDTGRKGEKGAMVEVEWTKPEPNGSHWPALKDKEGNKRTNEKMRRLKRERRIRVKLAEMARLGVSSLTFGTEQIDQMIERKVIEQVREADPVEKVEATPAQANENARLVATTNRFTTPRIPFRLIDGGKAA